MLKLRTILVPTDFSEASRLAFELACGLARDHGAEVVVANVVEPPAVVAPDGVAIQSPAIDMALVREQVEAIRPKDPNVGVWHRVETGDPAGQILRTAADVQADLIVMGTHGRTGLRRVLLGSVAEAVMRRADCPVLTVKARPAAAAPAAPAAPAERAVAVG